MKRIYERDTMFARMNYKVGSKSYEDYHYYSHRGRHEESYGIRPYIKEPPEWLKP